MRYLHFLAVLSVFLVFNGDCLHGQPPGVKKEDLRYDGKPFSYWQAYLRTELKAELRIEALRAIANFGANGYGEEAVAAIVNTTRAYDASAFAWPADSRYWTPHRHVTHEAVLALARIGPAGSLFLAAHLDDPQVARLAQRFISDRTLPQHMSIAPGAVPALFKHIQGDSDETRWLALQMLAEPASERKSVDAAMSAEMAKEEDAKRICAVLFMSMKGNQHSATASRDLLKRLGPRAAPVVPLAIEELRRLAAAVNKEGEQMKDAETGHTLLSDSAGFSLWYISVLASMGPAAKSALPVLEQFDQDANPQLQSAAKEAITAIGQAAEKAKKTSEQR